MMPDELAENEIIQDCAAIIYRCAVANLYLLQLKRNFCIIMRLIIAIDLVSLLFVFYYPNIKICAIIQIFDMLIFFITRLYFKSGLKYINWLIDHN